MRAELEVWQVHALVWSGVALAGLMYGAIAYALVFPKSRRVRTVLGWAGVGLVVWTVVLSRAVGMF